MRLHVEQHPDATQKERAQHFGVSRHCIWYGLQRLKVAWKKNTGDKERDEQQRQTYLRRRERYRRQGKELIDVDESGFAPVVTRRYAYAPKGQRVYEPLPGQRRLRTSLIAARMGPTLQAPLLFEGSCTTALFNAWLA